MLPFFQFAWLGALRLSAVFCLAAGAIGFKPGEAPKGPKAIEDRDLTKD